ncbi:ACIDIC LEUCINE-RICH NUCLEAR PHOSPHOPROTEIN 32 FAMILY B PROTEIN [Salix viminalis]|uniref:ACIDIC LEUCINE-RICH NUCLEAR PHOSPHOPROTEIN 32 FAMILY B PROTEIN n=1 Tax=Salix viminalis TaxID=40686 RepID=A0A9Q0UF99_SALVM|nr:ACIDIC LEUCINE-RICH NUCLEAR PHOSPHOPROTEIN 32 FAMILY B PROTEIN [Salix viminalis]
MSELSSPSTATKKTHHLSSLLLSDLFLFFSFILSHPLYFSYLVFFSPYLFKLLSFLSPLFITTSLLLLALLTISPNLVNDSSHAELYGSKEMGLESFIVFEELEAYKIVFETSNLGVEDDHNHTVDHQVTGVEQAAKDGQSACPGSTDQLSLQVHEGSTHQALGAGGGVSDQALNVKILDENQASITRSESNGRDELINIAEGKTLGGFLHQKEEFEDLWFQKEEIKEVLLKPLNVNSNKVEDRKEEQPMIRSGSKATSGQKMSEAKVSDDDGGEHYYSPKVSSRELEPNPWSPGNGGDCTSKGSFGSMRKEKEWRRTLACKLFEERHNVDGGEGMDMLWETYETDSTKVQAKSKTKKGKKGSVEYYDDDEEDLEEERSDGQLCCLQALKFSAGKMSLGMGRPNLVKISKALKGIGWLHHVSKHSKKGQH